MRKELYVILLFFLVILSSLSLISYSSFDPSINNVKYAAVDIKNIFGILGAYFAGSLIGFFGIGSFLLPPLLLLFGIRFLKRRNNSAVMAISGGLILMTVTGSILSVFQDDYFLLGTKFSSGGIIGMALQAFFVKYANIIGALIIFGLLWIVGFILATDFSIIKAYKLILHFIMTKKEKINTFLIKRLERRKKAERLIKEDMIFQLYLELIPYVKLW